jgi:hypothetical protein
MVGHCSSKRLEEWPFLSLKWQGDNVQSFSSTAHCNMSLRIDNAQSSCWTAYYLLCLNGNHTQDDSSTDHSGTNQRSANSRPRSSSHTPALHHQDLGLRSHPVHIASTAHPIRSPPQSINTHRHIPSLLRRMTVPIEGLAIRTYRQMEEFFCSPG